MKTNAGTEFTKNNEWQWELIKYILQGDKLWLAINNYIVHSGN